MYVHTHIVSYVHIHRYAVYTCTVARVDVGKQRQKIFSDLKEKEKFLRKNCSWAVTPGQMKISVCFPAGASRSY